MLEHNRYVGVGEPARGRGIAQALLGRIEAEARAAGLTRLQLETGDRQLASMRFYERSGFTVCEAFRAYAAMPAASMQTSVFFAKRI